jgi:spore cortex formation protein SpoVR/YcgB (stage V sporulation)
MMRDLRLFALHDKAADPSYKVSAIHNDSGYRSLRTMLARQYDIGIAEPNIQVLAADLKASRELTLQHRMHRGVPLQERTKNHVLAHVERLWGHQVGLEEVEAES